jgi:hypothetical protein
VREVGTLPPYLLGLLPAPTTLACVARETRFHVTTSRGRYAALREAGELVLSGGEVGALAVAAESGRASAVWLASWLADKQANPTLRLDVETALGGVEAGLLPRTRWPLARVAMHWGFHIESVEVEA